MSLSELLSSYGLNGLSSSELVSSSGLMSTSGLMFAVVVVRLSNAAMGSAGSSTGGGTMMCVGLVAGKVVLSKDGC